MPRRRPGISGQSELSWMAKHLDVSSVAGDMPAPEALPPRITHPVIAAPRRKCWRVLRLYRLHGTTEFEDIGAFPREGEAILCSVRELGCCRVLDPEGKVRLATNGQPIEDRTPSPAPASVVSASPSDDAARDPSAPNGGASGQSLVVRDDLEDAPAVTVFERLARDPQVTLEKLNGLLAFQERVKAAEAKAAFVRAFAEMQGEIPVITEDGRIEVDGVERSTYATNENIQAAVKPILRKYGFSIRFRNSVKENQLSITGILSHRDGHSEEDVFVCPPDTSGKKNTIQAMGSTRSYGQRYTTIALLNIATRGVDDDGDSAEEKAPPEAPGGFGEWIADLEAVADEGWPKLSKTWGDSRLDYRQHLMKIDRGGWDKLKARAEAASKAATK